MSITIHFEIPAEDIDRIKKFYSELFGWEFEEVAGRENYLMINTTGNKEISGSVIKRMNPQQKIINYIEVTSIDECINKIEKLEGKLIIRKKAIPKKGYFSIFLDPENNKFGLWEENINAR